MLNTHKGPHQGKHLHELMFAMSRNRTRNRHWNDRLFLIKLMLENNTTAKNWQETLQSHFYLKTAAIMKKIIYFFFGRTYIKNV